MMSRPHSICLRTTVAMASRTAALSSARRAPGFCCSASSSSTTFAVRGRLPVWVVRIRSVLRVISLKPAHDLGDVLDLRRRSEAVADQLAPLLEVGGLAEVLGVVFQRFPLHEQPVARRVLVRALQRHELAAFGAL